MIKLIYGDCLEVMKEIDGGSIDAVITDPPYGTTQCKWDSIINLNLMWEQLNRIIKPKGVIVLNASQPFTSFLISSNYVMFKNNLVWNKKMPTGHLNAKKKQLLIHEDILIFSKAKFGRFTYNPAMRKGKLRNKSSKRRADDYGNRAYGKVNHKSDNYNDQYYPTSILEISNANQKNKQHPTQKPVELMEYLIKTYTHKGETVLDFTMGSGTTMVACENTGRNGIGIENNLTFFEIAQQRVNQKTKVIPVNILEEKTKNSQLEKLLLTIYKKT